MEVPFMPLIRVSLVLWNKKLPQIEDGYIYSIPVQLFVLEQMVQSWVSEF